MVCLAITALSGCGGGGGGNSRSGSIVLDPTTQFITTREQAEARGKWTILIYLDADNDLESMGIANFNQMESIGSTTDVHIIVQMDRKDGADPNNEHWTDTRRYLITHDTDSNVMHSIRLDDPPLGELDMGNPNTLRNFVTWGEREFPSDHYCLIIWDHGSGWQIRTLSVAPEHKYIATDDTSADSMNITDIPSALAGANLDVIAFDACYMQELEVAYELRNSAHYLVASTAAEPSQGYNYARWLNRINGSTSPEDLCRTIVEAYAAEYPNPHRDITQSAIDLTLIQQVADSASAFATLLRAKASTYSIDLADARDSALNYSADATPRYNVDLLDYANRCSSALGAQATATYSALNSAMNSAVIASIHNLDMPNAHGLAIYVPPPSRYDFRYSELQLASDTEWDEWLRAQQQ